MASPTVRGRTAAVAGLSTTSPSATAIGDLVIVFTWERATTDTPPTHSVQGTFDEIVTQVYDESTNLSGRLSIASKVAEAGGANAYQAYTSDNGAETWTGCVVIQTGTYSLNAIVGTTVSTTTTGAPDPPNLTLGATRDWLVLAIGAWHHSASATITPGVPTNYTNLTEVAGASTGEVACSERSLTAAASENPATYTDNITPNGTAAATIGIGSILSSASPSVSPSLSQSPSASVSPSVSPSGSVSPSASASPSVSPSASTSPSASVSPSVSPSLSVSPSASQSPSISPSASASPSSSASPSVSPSGSASPSASLSPSASASPSVSPSSSVSPSAPPGSPSSSESASLSPSPSVSPSASISPSASTSPSASASPSISPSASVSPSHSASPSASASPSPPMALGAYFSARSPHATFRLTYP